MTFKKRRVIPLEPFPVGPVPAKAESGERESRAKTSNRQLSPVNRPIVIPAEAGIQKAK